MYESFFQLRVKPFELLSNPDFLFLSKAHKKAITYLEYALEERAGFMLLTGEIGSGKTTLIRELIRKHRDDMVLAKIFNTNITADQLIAMVVDDFGTRAEGRDKTTLLQALYEFLIEQYAQGKKPVLVIDEAQNLPQEALEEVRMLSNLESDSGKLLQIIMVGQPELRLKLASGGLLQLRHRISFSCHIPPLPRAEVGEYIAHRLEVAGNREAASFSPEALDMISRYSRGIPRLINILCDFLFLSAFAAETREISAARVTDVTGEMDFEHHFWGEADIPADGSEAVPSSAPGTSFVLREIQDRMDELASRIEALDVRHTTLNHKVLRDVLSWQASHERIVRDLMKAAKPGEEPALRDPKANRATTAFDPSASNREGEGKKGLLGKLFRAV